MKLLIAMPAPALPGAGEGASRATLPALPGLTQLLQQARTLPRAVHWREGVQRALGVQPGVPPAAIAAQATPALPRGSATCFVSPLHVVAGISRVHLPPGGRLHLEVAEAREWQAAFNAQFAVDGIRLHAAEPGSQWLLEAPFAHAAQDAEPGLLVGEALERSPAASEPARMLRRLGAEVEMWLAAHPLNRGREAAGLHPLNALWFWSGAVTTPVADPTWRGRLVTRQPPDAWTCGLARLLATAPHSLQQWPMTTAGEETWMVVLEPDSTAVQDWLPLESDWFLPLAQAVVDGRVGTLRLQIGTQCWQGPDRSALRWLRRRSL